MDSEDHPPRTAKAELKNLDEMSIEAIGTYIEMLKTEIKRAETAITTKKAARHSAHAVFKP